MVWSVMQRPVPPYRVVNWPVWCPVNGTASALPPVARMSSVRERHSAWLTPSLKVSHLKGSGLTCTMLLTHSRTFSSQELLSWIYQFNGGWGEYRRRWGESRCFSVQSDGRLWIFREGVPRHARNDAFALPAGWTQARNSLYHQRPFLPDGWYLRWTIEKEVASEAKKKMFTQPFGKKFLIRRTASPSAWLTYIFSSSTSSFTALHPYLYLIWYTHSRVRFHYERLAHP